jgi:hypothetical protein
MHVANCCEQGTQVQLHMQSLEVPVVLTKLIAILKRGGEVKDDKPRCVTWQPSGTFLQ